MRMTLVAAVALVGLHSLRVRGAVAAEARPADFHVATNGADDNPGTAAKPFATLGRARDAVRAKIAAGLKADVTVAIAWGRYFLTSPVVFGPEDSGTKEHAITYAAAPRSTATFSGGREITGWKKGKGDLWTAHLPDVQAGKWYFRQLFVNGQRRARPPTVH